MICYESIDDIELGMCLTFLIIYKFFNIKNEYKYIMLKSFKSKIIELKFRMIFIKYLKGFKIVFKEKKKVYKRIHYTCKLLIDLIMGQAKRITDPIILIWKKLGFRY